MPDGFVVRRSSAGIKASRGQALSTSFPAHVLYRILTMRDGVAQLPTNFAGTSTGMLIFFFPLWGLEPRELHFQFQVVIGLIPSQSENNNTS